MRCGRSSMTSHNSTGCGGPLIITLAFRWRIALVRVNTSIWMNFWCCLLHSTLKQSMRTVITHIKTIFIKAPLLLGRETRSALSAGIFLFVPGAADWLGKVSVFQNSILCIELFLASSLTAAFGGDLYPFIYSRTLPKHLWQHSVAWQTIVAFFSGWLSRASRLRTWGPFITVS